MAQKLPGQVLPWNSGASLALPDQIKVKNIWLPKEARTLSARLLSVSGVEELQIL